MSERRRHPIRPAVRARRAAMFSLTVAAVLGLGAGSTLAESNDELPPTAAEPDIAVDVTIQLVVEPPSPVDETVEEPAVEQSPPADAPAVSPVIEPNDGDGATEPDHMLPVDVVEPTAAAPPPGSETAPRTEVTSDPATGSTSAPASTDLRQEESPGDVPHGDEPHAGGPDDGHGDEPHEDGADDGHGDEPHEDGADDGHGDERHEDGHEDGHGGGGSGGHGSGQGNPYVMTFTVDWKHADGTAIPVLEGVLPANWRTLFELVAASQTGSGRPTAAHCTYADSSTETLVCEFENPPHRSDADGMIVPARPTATYTVSVEWEREGWTVDGADDGPHSARELCPRGSGGHDGGSGGHDGGSGGHDGGHDSGDGTDHAHLDGGHDGEDGGGHDGGSGGGHGGRTFSCEHTVVIRQVLIVEPDEPVVTEPDDPTPVTAEPSTVPAGVASARVTASSPMTLPATGSATAVMLAIAAALSVVGLGLVGLARRGVAHP